MKKMSLSGSVIILNGVSSSGKSTLAKALQKCSKDIYLTCSLDAFWNMTPYHVPANSQNFPNIKLAMAKSVKALAETGHNVIVDTIFSGKKTYQEIIKELKGFKFIIVKVECSLAELQRRELMRRNRKIGLAASQYDQVHKGVQYHLCVDTKLNSPSVCAKAIFDKMWK